MSHDTMREKVYALYDGELRLEERAAVQTHLDACPECRAALAAWKETAARVFRPLTVPASEDFVRGVMARIAEAPVEESLWDRIKASLTPPRLALAGAGALAASFVLWPDRPSPAADPEAAVLHVVEMMESPASEDASLDASVEEYFLS